MMLRPAVAPIIVAVLFTAATFAAQEIPTEYKTILSTLGKTGDFKEGVLKVDIPRSDLRVTINQRPAPTPFGFGGWVALAKGDGGHEVMMGDLGDTDSIRIHPQDQGQDRPGLRDNVSR